MVPSATFSTPILANGIGLPSLSFIVPLRPDFWAKELHITNRKKRKRQENCLGFSIKMDLNLILFIHRISSNQQQIYWLSLGFYIDGTIKG
jgi:hypothetical protein